MSGTAAAGTKGPAEERPFDDGDGYDDVDDTSLISANVKRKMSPKDIVVGGVLGIFVLTMLYLGLSSMMDSGTGGGSVARVVPPAPPATAAGMTGGMVGGVAQPAPIDSVEPVVGMGGGVVVAAVPIGAAAMGGGSMAGMGMVAGMPAATMGGAPVTAGEPDGGMQKDVIARLANMEARLSLLADRLEAVGTATDVTNDLKVRFDAIEARVSGIEKTMTATAAAAATTVAAVKAKSDGAAPTVSIQRVAGKPAAKGGGMVAGGRGCRLQGASEGSVIVADGQGGVREVRVGQSDPCLGKVNRIGVVNGRWQAVGSGGVLQQ